MSFKLFFLPLVLVILLIFILDTILRIFNYINSPWKKWAQVLKPFQKYFDASSCDILHRIVSRNFFSRKEDYFLLNTFVLNKSFDYYSDVCNISIRLARREEDTKHLIELLFNLAEVNCYIGKITFKFKTQKTLEYFIDYYDDFEYLVYDGNEFKYFPTSEEAFKFIEEKLLLDLFT